MTMSQCFRFTKPKAVFVLTRSKMMSTTHTHVIIIWVLKMSLHFIRMILWELSWSCQLFDPIFWNLDYRRNWWLHLCACSPCIQVCPSTKIASFQVSSKTLVKNNTKYQNRNFGPTTRKWRKKYHPNKIRW